jgi:ABC-2 type transport system permease protein
MSTFVSDTLNVMNRELKPVWREPMAVVFAMIQPLVFLGLFAPCCPRWPPADRRSSGSCPASSR